MNKYKWDYSRGLLRVPIGRTGLDQEYNNRGGVNKWLLFFSSVAMRLCENRSHYPDWYGPERWAHGGLLFSESLEVEARLKNPPGGNKTQLSESLPLHRPPFYNHVRSSLVGDDRRRRGSLQIYRSGPAREGMEIHFRIISRRERRTSSAMDLAPLPIGLNEKVFCPKGSFGSK